MKVPRTRFLVTSLLGMTVLRQGPVNGEGICPLPLNGEGICPLPLNWGELEWG